MCRNRSFYDPNYTPKDYTEIRDLNPGNVHRMSFENAQKIRMLHDRGFNNREIQQNFYPSFSESTISDIVRGISHNN